MKEIWKDIDGFPGYRVSTFGNVIGPKGNKLKWCFNPNSEYPKVTLCKSGKEHVDKRINQLVAIAFLPNPDELSLVMHLDNNPKNNHVDNLQWGTYSENNQYMYDCGRHPMSPAREIIEMGNAARRTDIIAININTRERLYFISQHEAARQLGIRQQHIWGVLNGYRRMAGGYYFKYADDEKECKRTPHRYNKRIRFIKAINTNTGDESIFRTKNEAIKKTGISCHVMTKILMGDYEEADGYTFQYMSEEEYYERDN